MNPDNFSVKEMIHQYVMSYHASNCSSTDPNQAEQVYQYAEERLYQLTRSEIIKDLTELEKKQINKQVKHETARQKVKSISHLLLESGLLALLIGLLVNQLTNGISTIFPKENKVWWGFLLCVSILILIGCVYAFLVYSGINELLGLGDVNESDES